MTGVTSSAALATVTIGPTELESDFLLQWIIQIASPLQLTVQSNKKHKSMSLELPSGIVMTQRNAILRCICGMGLHNALDVAPYFLCGGHSQAILASPKHAIAMASIQSWMSVADQISSGLDSTLLSQLEVQLKAQSFLVPNCCQCTIADVDVAVAILKQCKKDESFGATIQSSYPNVYRWLRLCSETLVHAGVKVPSDMLKAFTPLTSSPPMFFYGTEELVLPSHPQPTAPAKTTEAPKKEEGKKQQQQQQQEQKGKKQDKQQKQKQPQQQQQPKQADFDVSALDIRVGKIIKAWHHPEAEKLFCEEIDVGEDAPRQIASGLRPFYQTSDLDGRRVLVLCNLKKRNLVGFPSHGMVLCASNADHTSVEFMEPPEATPIGERVLFAGFENGQPEPENKIAKKKIFETVAPDLKTNDKGICVWKGAISKTTGGPIMASKGMPNAQVS